MSRTGWLVILASAAALVALVASYRHTRAAPARSGEVRIASVAVPDRLDPTSSYHLVHFLIGQSIQRTLVRMSDSGHIRGDLAKSWEATEGGRVFTFHLDPSARFWDGSPVQARDVAYSLSRHFWPGSRSPLAAYFTGLIEGSGALKKGGDLSFYSGTR